MAGKEGKASKKRRGVRRYFSKPKKGCRTYGAKKNWRHSTQQLQPVAGTRLINNDTAVTTAPTLIQENVSNDTNSVQFDKSVKQKLTVLSLFDGLSAGYFALSRKLNFDLDAYFSSEIDKDALQVQQFHFFKEVTPVGDVTHLSRYHLKKFGKVQLLIGGSPCNDISKANPVRKKLYDPDGTGILFFDFIRIRGYLQSEAECEGYDFFWMFENVTNLDSETLVDLNMYLGCSPIKMIPSSSTRTRYFWGNLPDIQYKHMDVREEFVPLQRFLKPYRRARVDLLPTITTCSNSTRKKGTNGEEVLVYQNGEPSFLFTTEIEESFNFPPHFTDVANLSASRRLKLLGKTWDIGLVEAILTPLLTLFRRKANIDS